MQQETVSNLIRKYFAAFLAQDRQTLEEGLSDDFTFTSPRDDHISKSSFFERCLPGSEQFLTISLVSSIIWLCFRDADTLCRVGRQRETFGTESRN